MAFNLVDLVKDQVGSAVMNQLGSVLGGNSDVTEKAVGGALPAILQGLMGSASTTSGADSLFKAVQDQDDGILSNLGDLIGGGTDSPFASAGSSILSSLLGGGALGNLASAIAGFSGLGKGKSSSLMGLLAPIILSVIKRKVLGGGLNASSLASMMLGQKDNISGAMPAGLSDQLNSSGFLDSIGDALKGGADTVADTASAAADVAGDAVDAVGDAAVDTAKAGGSLIGKLLPLILIAGLAFFAFKMCSQNTAVETTERTSTVVAPTVVEEQVIVPVAPEVIMVPEVTVGTYLVSQTTTAGNIEYELTLNADGSGTITGPAGVVPFSGASIDGDSFSFDMQSNSPNGVVELTYSGIVSGDSIDGVTTGPDGESVFMGTRK